MRDSIAEYAGADSVIVSGTVGASDAAGVRFTVAEWFWGTNPAQVVWLDQRSFGDGGGDCTTPRPPVGSQLLLVGHRARPVDPLSTGLCSPAADLTTAVGQATLAEVRAAFAAVSPPAPTPETAPPAPEVTATPPSVAPIVVGLLAGAIVLFGAVVLVARRARPRAG